MILFARIAALLQRIPERVRLVLYLVLAAGLFGAKLLGEITDAELDQALDVLAGFLGVSALVTAANVPTRVDS